MRRVLWGLIRSEGAYTLFGGHTLQSVTTGKMRRDLKPTLWRTCRVLANAKRLRLLRRSPQTVAELAAGVNLPVPVASQYLRLLQARGLIQSERLGRRVFYWDHPDPSVSHAASLLTAMKSTLAPGQRSLDDALFVLTAFTHPRRLQMIRALGVRGLCAENLRRVTGIPAQALRRHLVKLRRRGMLTVKGGRIRRSRRPPGTLARALMREACRFQR